MRFARDTVFIHISTIIIVGLLLYTHLFFFEFTYLDDTSLIVDNAPFLARPSSVIDSFRYDVGGPPSISPGGFGFYRPLLTLSFIANYAFGGSNPLVYHVTNVLLHIVATILLYLLFVAFRIIRSKAWWLSLVFLVHPLALSVAAWIPGRNDALLAIFVFSSIYAFIMYWEKNAPAWLWAHMSLFFCAIFTKETAFILPLICVAYVGLIGREPVWRLEKRRILCVVVWAVLLLVWVLMRHAAMFEDNQTINPIGALGAMVMHAPGALSYFEKIVAPWRLSVYPIRQDLSLWLGSCIGLLLFLLVITTRGKRQFVMAFGLLWAVLFIAPGLVNTQPIPKADFAEHRVYIPLFGILLILSQIYLPLRFHPAWRMFLASLCIAVLAILNIRHAGVYRDAPSFWGNAIATSPHASAAHNGLGAYYYLQNDLDRAEQEFRKAIELNDAGSEHHYNLGMVYLQRRMYAEAKASFYQELNVNASYIKAYLNLGALYFFEQDYAQAETIWLEGLKINPDYNDIHNNLAYLYYQQGDIAKAIVHARHVLDSGGMLRKQVQEALFFHL